MGVVVKAATDRGRKREQNEDSHACWIPETRQDSERLGILLIVADGMGGSRAGEVASRIAIDTVLSAYRGSAGNAPDESLFRALEQANEAVHRESVSHPERGGMGTTCTAIVVRSGEIYLGHVGDSRAYIVQKGKIRQLTQDHSLVAQLVRDHQITEEQARVDPRRNVVTRSVGVGAHVEIDVGRVNGPLKKGDTLVLCSDGLYGVVTDEEIAALATHPSLDRACAGLIDLANERGGPDNITVILARNESLDDTAEISTQAS